MSSITTKWRKILPLLLIMAIVAISVGGITLTQLYQTAFEEASARLVETAQSRARLMEAIARFNNKYSQDFPGGSFNASLSQIREAHENFEGFGQTGEFTLAKLDGEKILFLLRHRHQISNIPSPVLFHQDIGKNRLAEPMRRALLGQPGIDIAPDYRGTIVLAAYEPVAVLNIGVVAKIDLAEIRQPFINAGGILLGISFILIGIGTALFFRISDPMIRDLMESEMLRISQQELLKAKQEIKKKAIYLDNILHSALDTSIIATDDQFVIRYFNPAAEKIFGYSRDSIIGRTVMDVHEWENVDPDKFVQGLQQIQSSGSHIYHVIKTEPQHKIVKSRASSIRDESNTLVGYVLMSKDITDQQLADEALVRSERKYRLLMEYANDAILVADASTGLILDANRASAKLLGRPVKDIIGMHQAQLHPAEKAEEYKRIFEKNARDGSGIVTDIVVVHKSGHHIPVEIHSGVTDLGDKQVIQGIFRDITDRKQAEKEIRDLNANLERRVMERTRQLEDSNKELEAFSYSVAHDLRAPLNNILGFSRILFDEYQDQFNTEGREQLEWLQKSTLMMQKRVNDYLNLARSTKVSIQSKQVNLSDLIENAILQAKAFHPEFESVKTTITPGLMAMGDPGLLTVVAENLISNALKFTSKIEKAHICFGVQHNDKGDKEFFIQDNGMGFDPRFTHRLFKFFERLHDTEAFEGSGIGLTTVQRIIKRHEGTIRAESKLGEGATFYFTLGGVVQ
ncbi:MAG: PAS domain S-box protein [Magnetococcales bacterium]|nr:PAS domain S-box protein [Magnetococcales bacterium]